MLEIYITMIIMRLIYKHECLTNIAAQDEAIYGRDTVPRCYNTKVSVCLICQVMVVLSYLHNSYVSV